MIPAKTQYKTHNGELLAIVKSFQIWKHYLEGYKHEVLIFIDYNNLEQFMDTKSLSFSQVYWAQKLSYHYFWINYCQDKANRAADTLFYILQKTFNCKEKYWAENTWILYCL